MDFASLLKIYREGRIISSIDGTLHWDMETMMPSGGAERRGEQMEYLSRLKHRTLTQPKFLEKVELLKENDFASTVEKAQVRALKREVAFTAALPEDLVGRLSSATVASWGVWKQARAEKNFSPTVPHLQRLLDLQAEMVAAYREHPYLASQYRDKTNYEVLFDTYEPGFSAKKMQNLLSELASAVSARLPALEAKYGAGGAAGMALGIPEQEKMCRKVAADIGLSPEISRLDISAHPFSTNLYSDFRITTRFLENDALNGLMSTIHEVGHALYESGLPNDLLLTPAGTSASLGVHESQSRFWENFIGRSDGFVEYLVKGFSLPSDAVMSGLREVKRSYVRVDADEVSYHLHIALRAELEEALVSGKLAVKDLPDAWNARFEELFGMKVPDNALGCLQDIHWYHGSFGYFPTYSLGTLFAAELFVDLRKELPDWEKRVSRGEFAEILGFLRKRVHSQAALKDSPGVMREAIGRDVGVAALLEYFETRYPS